MSKKYLPTIYKILIPFLTGILVAVYILNHQIGIAAFILISSLFILWLLNRKYRNDFLRRWRISIGYYLSIFSAAMLLTLLNFQISRSHHIANYLNCNGMIARVVSAPLIKEKSIRYELEIENIYHLNSWNPSCGKILCYFKKDSLEQIQLKYGDKIYIPKKQPVPISPPANPEQFDYKLFLSFHNIYQQLSLSRNDWILFEDNRSFSIIGLAISFRDRLLEILRKTTVTDQEYAVAGALLIGYEDEVNAETISAYSASGALHVLSVSGLHVGIIYLAFDYLLFFLNGTPRKRIVKVCLLILLLWTYATITGLSPSVLRSAAMFTFIGFGAFRNKKGDIFYALAASAIFLLLYDPLMIMQVGFQLSYLAVFGIIVLQKPIYNLYVPKNWFMHQLWSITAVSLAAQIATFPLGLLYFHQFPIYFLFSNLVVIPVSSLLLYAGLLYFIFGLFNYFSIALGFIIKYLVIFINWFVAWIEQLPLSLINGITITVFETYLIYVAIVFFYAFCIVKHHSYIKISMACCIVLVVFNIYESFVQRSQTETLVYSISRHSAISYFNGNQEFFYADTGLVNNKSMMLFNVLHHRWSRGIAEKNVTIIPIDSLDPIIKIGNKLIVKFDWKLKGKTINHNLNTDVLYCRSNFFDQTLIQKINTKLLIADGSNGMKHKKRLAKYCNAHQITFIDLMENGAYQIPL